MNKTNVAFLLIGIVIFVTSMYFVHDARNEVASSEVTMEISKTLEESLDRENISVSSAEYLIGNYTIGAMNETDFIRKIKENEIKIVYFNFEEGVGELTKKYWGMMPNGIVELKQDYKPVNKTYFWGIQAGYGYSV